MFAQLFSTMNDLLDQIARQYREADHQQKKQYQQQLSVLKAMSADCMEHWLLFEEKISRFMEEAVIPDPFPEMNDGSEGIDLHAEAGQVGGCSEAFERGQGYFKLMMFDEAIREFAAAVRESPNFVWARVYLALGFLHKGDYSEAYRQFRFIIPMTAHERIQAIAYNAMGCIQASKTNYDEAVELFEKAHRLDPTLKAPLTNLAACRKNKGRLHDGAEFVP